MSQNVLITIRQFFCYVLRRYYIFLYTHYQFKISLSKKKIMNNKTAVSRQFQHNHISPLKYDFTKFKLIFSLLLQSNSTQDHLKYKRLTLSNGRYSINVFFNQITGKSIVLQTIIIKHVVMTIIYERTTFVYVPN